MLRAIGATVLFAAVHSLLASEGVKRNVAKRIAPRSYRAAYNAQAVATTVALFLWLRRTAPDRTAYEIKGPTAWAMRGGQIAALLSLIGCIRAVGLTNFLGLDRGRLVLEAQGPARDDSGALIITGPFKRHRHPTNFWPIVLLWLQPHMTHARLGFSIAASVYLYVGSLHQDARLRDTYDDVYARYCATVPFFFPTLNRLPTFVKTESTN
jgi:protein-S-isoprenylcysteine O-methyltransferase Ste14